ncbi:MAG: type II toxin-antitoxin system VapC family toxin [Dehalococcoidia bacterium]|nr:type II toxin-antitoxin system VapC family toxin [Dehalococcoidia bacterium]
MAKYVLDTTVLIDHLQGRNAVVELLASLAGEGHELGVCDINIAELYAGLRQDEQAQADRLIDSLSYFVVTYERAKQAGAYRYSYNRQGTLLTIADTLVAATAVGEGATLITANRKDFPMPEIILLQSP